MLNRRLAEHYGIPGVSRRAVPQGAAAPGQPSRRHPDAGEHPEGDRQRHAQLARDARGLGDEAAARPPVAAAPAPTPAPSSPTPAAPPRSASNWTSTAARPAAPSATSTWTRPASRWRTTTSSAAGASGTARRARARPSSIADRTTGKNNHFRHGPPVDPSGELADGRKFANIDELKTLLLDQQDAIARNLVNNLVTYATGAGVTFADREEVQAILPGQGPRLRPAHAGIRGRAEPAVSNQVTRTR